MKLIKLTQGKFAQVDDEDFEELNKFKWYAHRPKKGNTFYAVRHTRKPSGRGKQTTLQMHRVIMGVHNETVSDHRDGDGLNNQKAT